MSAAGLDTAAAAAESPAPVTASSFLVAELLDGSEDGKDILLRPSVIDVGSRRLLCLAAMAVVGALCVITPHLAQGRPSGQDATLLTRSIDGFGPPALLLLVVAGVAFGSRCSVPSWKLGVAAVVALPVWTLIDIIVEPTSHNLWPFEWLFYPFVAGPVFVGAELARRYAARRASRTN